MASNWTLTPLPSLVVFDTFDLRGRVNHARGNGPQPPNRKPEVVTEWLDDVPRLAVDRNGDSLILHIPGWQREKALVSDAVPYQPCALTLLKRAFSEICFQLSEIAPPACKDGADQNWRSGEGNYRPAKGELHGRIKLVTAWQGIGHSVSNLTRLQFCRRLIFQAERDPGPVSFSPGQWTKIWCLHTSPLRI